jgi:hypothetical protein
VARGDTGSHQLVIESEKDSEGWRARGEDCTSESAFFLPLWHFDLTTVLGDSVKIVHGEGRWLSVSVLVCPLPS